MVNKKKIRLTEEEFKQFVGEIVDSVMLNEQADYSKFANQLYNAMDGAGTDEETVRKISNSSNAPDIAKWFDQNKNRFEGYTLKQWIEGDFSGYEVNTLLDRFGYGTPNPTRQENYSKNVSTYKLDDGICPTPKPIQRPGAPKLKVGDQISGVFIVTNIQKSYHSNSEVDLYKTGRSNIGVFADNILSSWDGEPPLQIQITLERKHDKNTPEVEYEYSDELGRFTNANDGYGSEKSGNRGKDPIYVEQNQERISYLSDGLSELRDQLGDESELLKVGVNSLNQQASTREVVITITLNNNPQLWQLAKEFDLKSKYGGRSGYANPQEGEWARKGCTQRVEADVDFIVMNRQQRMDRFSGNKSELVKVDNSDQSIDQIFFDIKTNYSLSLLGQKYRKLYLEDTPYDEDSGNYVWRKSGWNPATWSVHTYLDIAAIAGLIVAGFFSGGVAWAGLGVYIGANLVNAAIYVAEGDYAMAGVFLLLDFIPGGKLTKGLKTVFRSLKSPVVAIRGMFEGFQILRSGGAKNFRELFKFYGANPESLKIMRALAEAGEEGIKNMRVALKNMKNVKPTRKEAREFIEGLKTSGDANMTKLAKELTENDAIVIINQQRNRMARYFDDLLNGGTILQTIAEAGAVIFIMDANLPIALWEEYVKQLPLKDRTKVDSFSDQFNRYMRTALSKVSGGDDIVEKYFGGLTDKEVGSLVDIINSTPFTDEDRENEAKAKSLLLKQGPEFSFYEWDDGAANPSWKFGNGIKNQYSAATSTDLIDDSTGAKIPTNCKWINPDHYGVTKKHKIGSYEFNSSLKEDWLSGWRPGYCVESPTPETAFVNAVSTPKESDISEEAYDNRMGLLEDMWPIIWAPAAEKYKEITETDLTLKIKGRTYNITSSFDEKLADIVVRLPEEAQQVLTDMMLQIMSGDLSENNYDFNTETGALIPDFTGQLSVLNQYANDI